MKYGNRLKVRITRSVALVSALVLLYALPASSAPFAPLSDHTGEDHSRENHRGEDLRGIVLILADVNRTDFRNSNLLAAVFNSANADRANFRNANLVDTQFLSAILDGAQLRDADLTGADLSNASLVDASVREAAFINAVLDGVVFGRTDVRDANFSGASLLGANMADIRNAASADFSGASYDASTVLAAGMDLSVMTFVPEPSSALLLGLGLIGLQQIGRRSRSREPRAVISFQA